MSESKLPSRKRYEIGQAFNPWHKECGFYPPDVVARQRDLTDGQKRLYERSVRWAGQNGTFWYSFEAMAEAVGKSVRQVKSDMAELERRGLLAHERRGKRQSNLYRFLWHPIFNDDVQRTAHQPSDAIPFETPCEVQPAASLDDTGEVQDLSSEVQSNVKSEVQPTAREFSPLLNSVQNRVQQQKLITGAESQKTAIRTPGAGTAAVGFDDKNGKPDHRMAYGRNHADLVGLSEPSPNGRKAPCRKARSEDFMKLRAALIAYMGEIPPPGFEDSCLLRARGATAADIVDLLNRRWRTKKHRPGARCGPRSWNWFLTVIANEFSPAERAHLPEATPNNRQRVSEQELARGIEALESNSADSLIAAYRCKCGTEIRQYQSRIEGTCTCAPRRKNLGRFSGDMGLNKLAIGGAR